MTMEQATNVATGQFAEGHAALLHGISLVPAELVALRVRLTTACAGMEHLLGRHEQAHARLATAMGSLRDPASREAAALMIELALRLDAAANLAGAELYLDRYDDAEAHAERAISIGRATAQSEFIPLPYSILGQVKLLRGQLAEAAELLDNAVEGARLSGNVQALAGNLGNRSLAALAAGDVGIALATAEECVELTSGLDQSLACAAGVLFSSLPPRLSSNMALASPLTQSSPGPPLTMSFPPRASPIM